MNGILLISKPANMTSRQVVDKIIKLTQTRKVGHTGTLDPIATGVLVITIGKATKLTDVITNLDKEYIAQVTLGIETDTLDITGKIIKQEKVKIKKVKIENNLKKMIGTYDQEVPIYSAVKINGKKLYEYARHNQLIDLPKRTVTVKSLQLISPVTYENDKTVFEIKCLVSKGTYIRSLINDLAHSLNTIGTMSALKRTKQGTFTLEECQTLEQIDMNKLIDLSTCLNEYYRVEMDEQLKKQIDNGQILANKYKQNIVLFTYKQEAVALYKSYEKDNTKIKPWKMF